MKCIKKGSTIKRVRDDVAHNLCSSEGWVFCPKADWKTKKKEGEAVK